LVRVAVVVELCVSVVGWYGHEGVRCAFWHRCSSLASRASVQAASACCYWPRTASMEDWLVFRMGVATIRILIWNVTCMLHAEYRILLYVSCLMLIGIQTPAISLFLLTSHASLNSRLLV
jgi:hypothetical protein